MPDEHTLASRQADQARTDLAALESDLQFIMGQLARMPTRALFKGRLRSLSQMKDATEKARGAREGATKAVRLAWSHILFPIKTEATEAGRAFDLDQLTLASKDRAAIPAAVYDKVGPKGDNVAKEKAQAGHALAEPESYPKHILLGLLYILRAFVFTAYFVMPPTPASTLVFAAAMGMLWLSVAPLVSGLVAEIFGPRYMATLLGIAFVMHQVGSSLALGAAG